MTVWSNWFIFVVSVVLINGCSEIVGEKGNDTKLFALLKPSQTGITFRNHLVESSTMNGLVYEYYYNGAGVALSDVDNDGLVDILFVSSLQKNKLYKNQGSLEFIDISEESGVDQSKGFRTGISNVDINHDGWMDFYVCKSGQYIDPAERRNELWVNQGLNENGIPVFKEMASEYNLDIDMCSTQAAFFDFDRDGDLDMFLINHFYAAYEYKDVELLMNQKSTITGDRLYENRDGSFVDISEQAEIGNNSRLSYGLGVSVGDVNNDGWPDVYVANDYEGKDYLYLNNQDGTFRDVANAAMQHFSFYSMGTDMGDVNNDGWLDIMSLDMMAEDNYGMKTSMSAMNTEKFDDVVNRGLHYQYMYNALQISNGVIDADGVPLFSDVAQMAGMASTDWSWGPLIFDMDNDGMKDIFVSNGIKRDFRNNDFNIKYRNQVHLAVEDKDAYIMKVLDDMPERKKKNFFFKNLGNLQFERKNDEWVTDVANCSNGAAYADLDNDGDLDIVVNNADDVSAIYRNNSSEMGQGNFISIRLQGNELNPNGIGARVQLNHENSQQIQEHYLTRGFQSSVSTGLHFGLESDQEIDAVTVIWPDGKTQVLTSVKANQELSVYYKDAGIPEKSSIPEDQRLFRNQDVEQHGIDWVHVENDFDDFGREGLLPHRMSRPGPAMAVGDVNGDGRDDLFFGGAKGQNSCIYLQRDNGSFYKSNRSVFEVHKEFEDVSAAFFDADGDGDLDLYVVSGGNEMENGSSLYQDRFYENVRGAFEFRPNALPENYISGSCVRSYDYDQDGDLDLVVGGRQFPGKYPTSISSFLLRNDSKDGDVVFTDVTEYVIPQFVDIGMVTDILPLDLHGSGNVDLVVVGEWMGIRIFRWDGVMYDDFTGRCNLEDTQGWWNCIETGDFDQDGDLDLIVGNLGLNYKYKASPDNPFKVFASDFDSSGTNDIVLGFFESGHLYPLRGRQCSSEQMPFIKEEFATYDEFAKASLPEVIGASRIEQALERSAQTFASAYLENMGDGTFRSKPLPSLAQISSVNQIIVDDFNKDGNLDLILVGNLYGSEVETPRNDAGFGNLLFGDGKGNFKVVPITQSGLCVRGEVRSANKVKILGEPNLMFGINNEKPQMVRIEQHRLNF